MPPLLAPLLLIVSAAQLDPPESEPRRTAREVLEQLLAEDSTPGSRRDYRGRDHVTIEGRPRASPQAGLCEKDYLLITRAAKDEKRPEGGSALVEIKTERWYYVVADAANRPRWDLGSEPLDRECAKATYHRWFTATNAHAALSAVTGLAALKAELSKPGSKMIEPFCGMNGRCPDFARLAERIDPLQPSGAWLRERGCPQDRWCVDVLLEAEGCGAWSTQLRMESTEITRLRSARIADFVGALLCGEREMEREAAAAEEKAD